MAAHIRGKIWRGLENIGYTAIIESRAAGRSVLSIESLGCMAQCALEQGTFVQDFIAEELKHFALGEVKAALAEELAYRALAVVQGITGTEVLAAMSTEVAIVAVADHRRFRMSLPADRPGWLTTVPWGKRSGRAILLTTEDLTVAQKARALALGKKKLELRGGVVANAALGVKAPDCRARAIAAIGMRFRDIFSAAAPSTSRTDHKDRIFWRLQAVFNEEFPNLRGHLEFFGSSANGLEIKSSDVNFSLRVNWSEVAESLAEIPDVEVLAEALKRRDYFKEVTFIQARVPTCRFQDLESGLSCSVNFGDDLGMANSKLLRAYANYDARVPRLICLLKLWAQERQLDAAAGGLTGYALSLMAINFLQLQGVVPCLQDGNDGSNEDRLVVAKLSSSRTVGAQRWATRNVRIPANDNGPLKDDPTVFLVDTSFGTAQKGLTLSPGEVWTGEDSVPALFFRFVAHYGWDFRYAQKPVPSVRTGTVLKDIPSELSGCAANKGPALVVEDPFQPDRNTAATLKDLTIFVNEARRAANVLMGGPAQQQSVSDAVEELLRPRLADLRRRAKLAAKAAKQSQESEKTPEPEPLVYELVGFETVMQLERTSRPVKRDWSQPRRACSETRQSPVRLSTLITASSSTQCETISSSATPSKPTKVTPVLRLSDILFTWDVGGSNEAAPFAEDAKAVCAPMEPEYPTTATSYQVPVSHDYAVIATRGPLHQRPVSFHDYGRMDQDYATFMARRLPHERPRTPFGEYGRMDEGFDTIMAYGPQSYERPILVDERATTMDMDKSTTYVTRQESSYARPAAFFDAYSPINYCESTIVTHDESHERPISISSGEHATPPMAADHQSRIVTHLESRERLGGASPSPAGQQPARKRRNSRRGSRGGGRGRGGRGRKPNTGGGGGGGDAGPTINDINDTGRDLNRSWRRADHGGTTGGGDHVRTGGRDGRASAAGGSHARPGAGDGRNSASGGGHARTGGRDGRTSATGGGGRASRNVQR
ncbi:hypothetical protein HDU87_004818 [Geranomyces variabilis]|uniref:Poly(A) RNA polymerase mitochondrial-like central palm domain-containing protein n=1 Tax=Geranomyces variabilis TaxID=109894 RepID=A0AAD5TN86_9FUNG|nr:hypothetical protein HDU87_004818 [Geranomyces variabilis]